jgi:hypothetical protein
MHITIQTQSNQRTSSEGCQSTNLTSWVCPCSTDMHSKSFVSSAVSVERQYDGSGI